MASTAPEFLACPDCGGPLGEAPAASPDAGAALVCGRCARSHPIHDGVPCLLPGAVDPYRALGTRRAFRRQWRAYGGLRRIFGKLPAEMARNLVGPRLSERVDAGWYRGRRVLDAGCGHGRYLLAFAALGAEVVGLDLEVTPAARRAAAGHARIRVVQGSVLAPPFAARTFDLVFCDGVLHHTPDPAGGYQALARLVRPGGALYVWLYPREGRLREWLFGPVRAVTTRLPGPVVRWLSFLLAPLTFGVRSYSGTRFGRATWGECAQVVHDWIAPPLQSHHDVDEVSGWARAAGLSDLEVLPVPTGLTAWRRLSP